MVAAFCTLSAAAQVDVEYLGHASFAVKSPAANRVVLDPFNTSVWVGFDFPRGTSAAAVAVTHPHYDHDADYYFPFTPVFRRPGSYRIGDISLTGVRGKHAEPWGKEFGQLNTIFVVEAGGVRIAHLGDNGPLSPEAVRELGRVDVLLAPIDDTEHILKFAELDEIIRRLKPRIVVPMHYALEGLSPDHKDLGGISKWLAGRKNVRRLDSNRDRMFPGTLPRQTEVRVFRPSPELRRWPEDFSRAVAMARGTPAERLEAPRLAEKAGRSSIVIWLRAAEVMAEKSPAEAARFLEQGLVLTAPDDYERTALARRFLASLYRRLGRDADAVGQEAAAASISHARP